MVNINVRVPRELAMRIEKAVEIGRMEKAEIIRMAIDCGLDEMQRVGFDVRRVYKEAIAQSKTKALPAPSLKPLEAPKSSRSTRAGGAV